MNKFHFIVHIQINNGSTGIVLTSNQLLNLQGNYIQGNLGEDACPTGYYPIMGQDECEAAANYFGYDFLENPITAAVDENSVCNYCTGCNPHHVRLSSNHGSAAYWLCSSGGK